MPCEPVLPAARIVWAHLHGLAEQVSQILGDRGQGIPFQIHCIPRLQMRHQDDFARAFIFQDTQERKRLADFEAKRTDLANQLGKLG